METGTGIATTVSADGFALRCGPDGAVVSIIHDGLGVASLPTGSLDSALGRVVPGALASVMGAAFGLRLQVDYTDGQLDYIIDVVPDGGGALVIGRSPGGPTGVPEEDLRRICREQAATIRVAFGELRLLKDPPASREPYPSELERLAKLNNELVNMHRELAKANARLKEKTDSLSQIASTDHLTGCFNRRGLEVLGLRELERAKRTCRPLSLFMCDVDRFKGINDTHGHGVGDEILTHLGKLLREKTRNIDIVARYGGEEFAAVLTETGLQGAMRVAERIRMAVAAHPIATTAGELGITVSIGVGIMEEADTDLASILRKADEALYRAKAGGRNRVNR